MLLPIVTFSLPKLLVSIDLAESRSAAERLIKQGAVEINGKIVKDMVLIQVGNKEHGMRWFTREEFDAFAEDIS